MQAGAPRNYGANCRAPRESKARGDAKKAPLSAGALAVVLEGDTYVLLPEDAAEKLLDRAPELVVCFNERGGGAPDGPYSEHPVPDDLMW